MTDSRHSPLLSTRAEELFREEWNTIARQTSRLFGWLLVVQWVIAVVLTAVVSPYTWAGEVSRVHPHVWAAIWVGGLVVSCPVWLAFKHATWWFTRHAVAIAQMGIGSVLIHVLGGRIETHFHIFGSLAFLSFYRDWRPLLTATAIVAADHIARGALWPMSIYGIPGGAEWRWVEHATWVVFEVTFLLVAIRQSVREMRASAERQARLEQSNEVIEKTVETRTAELRVSETRYRLLFEAIHDQLSSIKGQQAGEARIVDDGGSIFSDMLSGTRGAKGATRLDIESGTIQPGRRVWSDAVFLGIVVGSVTEIYGKVFADNLPEPHAFELSIAVALTKRSYSFKDLRELPVPNPGE